ncbi:hypothetical protein CU097_011979 [Rhizopus azygosporus]|uniref:U1-type domain-containing protein n=1 Tax=Rhizopus azygosporus TaxID=86630 RepID=A0A367JRT6_RHIAZ|nr:hypothetical protein CU097_011979 [Rhizopus azygosporus]
MKPAISFDNAIQLIMADYWVSQQKHWCKYCKKFVANNKPSISLHENGTAHKAQVERFLRNVYKKGREEKEQQESVRKELQRIEQAALLSISMKDGPKHLSSSSSTSSITTTNKPSSSRVSRTSTSTGAYGYGANYYVPTIEELRNPTVKEQKVEGREEWAVSKDVAKVGEWEVVTPVTPPTSEPGTTKRDDQQQQRSTHDQAPEFQDDDEGTNEEDLNAFKLKEKEYPTNAFSIDDSTEQVVFKKRKLADSSISRKKKPLRKKEE